MGGRVRNLKNILHAKNLSFLLKASIKCYWFGLSNIRIQLLTARRIEHILRYLYSSPTFGAEKYIVLSVISIFLMTWCLGGVASEGAAASAATASALSTAKNFARAISVAERARAGGRAWFGNGLVGECKMERRISCFVIMEPFKPWNLGFTAEL